MYEPIKEEILLCTLIHMFPRGTHSVRIEELFGFSVYFTFKCYHVKQHENRKPYTKKFNELVKIFTFSSKTAWRDLKFLTATTHRKP